MKLFFLALLSLVLGCTTLNMPGGPDPRHSPEALIARSVALVKVHDVIDIEAPAGTSTREVRSFCSGTWIAEDKILTAAHCVVEDELGPLEIGDPVEYVMRDGVYPDQSLPEVKLSGTIFKAQVSMRDEAHDLAILRAERERPPHVVAPLHRGAVVVGVPVYTMGTPRGFWFSYSSGEVSGLRFELHDLSPESTKTLWVQSTAPVSPGSSGGGLFDETGALVGVCSHGYPRGAALGFWVHVAHVEAMVKSVGR